MANSFSIDQLRKKALLCQGLLRRDSLGRGLPGVLRCIEQLGYVQIDTISVVARAHHHVLWSRIGGYQPQMLDDLVARREVFEYWYHAAAYLPMRDFRYALPRMHAIKSGEKHWFKNKDRKLMQRIRKRIASEGPLMARDFDDKHHSKSGWWDWKPAKQALEQLFMEGDLMVVERRGFQKVYDLTENVLPSQVDVTRPNIHEQASYLIDTTIRAHGFATLKGFSYLRKGNALRVSLRDQLCQRVADKQLINVALPCGVEVFADPLIQSRKRLLNKVTILSPFDNSVIQRERCRQLFAFDFQIECYLPASKRKYGYFSLPILYRDKLVGRMDCKADRRAGVFVVNALHVESRQAAEFYRLLAESIGEYAGFNHCKDISLQCDSVNRKSLAAFL